MNKAMKFRLYPTVEQTSLFCQTFGCVRKTWNMLLDDRLHGNIRTPAFYKKEYPYLKIVDSFALSNVKLNLDKAFKQYYKDQKDPKKSKSKKKGFPKFKSRKHAKRSYTTNLSHGNIRLLDNAIRLPKAGIVKAVIHRKPDPSWRLKSVTVSQASDGRFYASVLFEYDQDIVPVDKDNIKAVGLDYKSTGSYHDSEGYFPDISHFYKRLDKKLKREQRKLSRKVGSCKDESKSKNYYKQLNRVNKIYTKIAHCRSDFLHKESLRIANSYDLVCIEDLEMKAIGNKKSKRGRNTMDNGWYMFTQMLAYKLADRGKYLVKVGKWYPSSQLCSNCGNRQKLRLSERTYACPVCGLILDRDHNAALNILHEGVRLLYENGQTSKSA